MVSTHGTTVMQESEHSQSRFVQVVLPWLLAGVVLLIYGLTLNHWVTLTSLPIVAKVSGWDWNTTLASPLLYLVTYPFRFLPASIQPVALNVSSAVCAGLTLVLLARSVVLLPHDRTKDQRQRERSEFSLLSIPAAWLPPVVAVLVCAFQLTFWEHATAITGEALNLLLFAYTIRCLLEFRIDQRESWLARMAFVYGLAVTNNWAMIGFFPAFVVALVWILGLRFFEFRFLTRMLFFGFLGLLLYLLIPVVQLSSGESALTFWQLLKRELATQKAILFFGPLRTRALVCGLTSILPMLVMGVRWPSTSGDVTVAGNLLTNLMFKVVHGIFLVACVWVAFDPKFSPRSLGLGLPFLTFYYLGALAVGYFTGYFLLVFGEEPERKSRRRPSFGLRLVNGTVVGLVWLGSLVVPAALIYKNLPSIKSQNGQLLKNLVRQQSQNLPPAGAVVLGDDGPALLLLEGFLREGNAAHPYLLLNTDLLQYHTYYRALQKRYGTRIPQLPLERLPEPIESLAVSKFVYDLLQTNQVYYLQPSFGYFFEYFYSVPRGLIYQLKEYPADQISVPALTSAEISENQQFWAGLQDQLSQVHRLATRKLSDPESLSRIYSRALNYWGVQLQRNDMAKEAHALFQRALELSADNVAAAINLKYNETPPQEKLKPIQIEKSIQDRLSGYRDVVSFLRICGPVDEPGLCMYLGQDFLKNNLYRQAAQQFTRVHELQPQNTEAQLWLANTFLQGQLPEKVLEIVRTTRDQQGSRLSVTNQLDLIRLEAWAYFNQTNLAKAKHVLLQGQKQYPELNDAWITISQMHMRQADFTNAIEALDEQLKINGNDITPLLNKSAIYIRLTNYQAAVPLLDRILAKDPQNTAALMNRGLACFQSGQLDAAQKDYEALLKLKPNYSLAEFRLGEIAERRNNTSEALRRYQQFIQRSAPGIPEVETAKQRVKQLEGAVR